jgi:hypothetical protein
MYALLKEKCEHNFNPVFLRNQSNIQAILHTKPVLQHFTSTGTHESIYKNYLRLRNENSVSRLPSYYFDIAESLFAKGDARSGLRVLSTLAELDLENPQYLRYLIVHTVLT